MRVRLTNEELTRLEEYLVGSSKTLDEGLDMLGTSFEKLDDTSFQTIDTLMFRCVICDNWHGISDLDGDEICESCAVDAIKHGRGGYEDLISCSDFGGAQSGQWPE